MGGCGDRRFPVDGGGPLGGDPGEHPVQLVGQERRPTVRHTHRLGIGGAQLPGPWVDVLQNPSVDLAQGVEREVTGGDRGILFELGHPDVGHAALELLEVGDRREAGQVVANLPGLVAG